MRQRPTRLELERDGPPVRLTDVAYLAGFSAHKLMADVQSGDLAIKWAKCGQRRMAMVERSEALRYLARIYAVAC